MTQAMERCLLRIYRDMGIPRDHLPYSPQMAQLTELFHASTGRVISEREAWKVLMKWLKKGGQSLKAEAGQKSRLQDKP